MVTYSLGEIFTLLFGAMAFVPSVQWLVKEYKEDQKKKTKKVSHVSNKKVKFITL